MLFDSLLKFWESQHFGNWDKLCVSLGGSCCCWQWMLFTLPSFLSKFVETGKLWWNSLLGIFTNIFVLFNYYWNGTAWMTAPSDVLYFMLTRSEKNILAFHNVSIFLRMQLLMERGVFKIMVMNYHYGIWNKTGDHWVHMVVIFLIMFSITNYFSY